MASVHRGRRLLADAKAGHVSLVLVWRLDRFGRNAVEILKAVEELEQAGARLVSLKESFDTRTAGGRLMLTVLAALSEYEWESIKERSEAGVARKLDGGGWMGGQVPYGYKVEGERPHSHLIPDDVEPLITLPSGAVMTAAEVVRMIYRLLIDDGLSTVKIAERLNEIGVPTSFTRKARRFHRGEIDEEPMAIWRANVVYDILSNPANKGEYTFGRRSRNARKGEHGNSIPREVVTVPIPALVSVETWDAAQAQLERNLIWSPRNAKHDYLLRGLITCGLCGHGFIGDARGNRRGQRLPLRYVCIARRHPRTLYGGTAYAQERRCTALPVRAAELEAGIWADVEQALRNPGPVLNSLAAQLSGTADAASELRAMVAAKQQERDEKQQEKDTVLALL
ncbi:MAG TPA: recombinase family protein [Ktedonobacterales bacterium]|nr:recombinase family protein [Ktedonobacterales bacterium]